jgi:hypothetical protein
MMPSFFDDGRHPNLKAHFYMRSKKGGSNARFCKAPNFVFFNSLFLQGGRNPCDRYYLRVCQTYRAADHYSSDARGPDTSADWAAFISSQFYPFPLGNGVVIIATTATILASTLTATLMK